MLAVYVNHREGGVVKGLIFTEGEPRTKIKTPRKFIRLRYAVIYTLERVPTMISLVNGYIITVNLSSRLLINRRSQSNGNEIQYNHHIISSFYS